MSDDTYMCKCDTCGEVMTNHAFNAGHKCEGFRDTAELDFDILRELAFKRITREEAWKRHDARREKS